MRRKLVAADASPLIGLAVAGTFPLLRELFGRVTVTRAVLDEIRAGGALPGAQELEGALEQGWIRAAPTPLDTWRFSDLGAGEASTIALALQHRGDRLVLMDDALGQAEAEAQGLLVMDLARVLLAARRRGLIAAVRPHLERLAQRGFTLPAPAVAAVLEEAGER